jgi:hypothetical protein
MNPANNFLIENIEPESIELSKNLTNEITTSTSSEVS